MNLDSEYCQKDPEMCLVEVLETEDRNVMHSVINLSHFEKGK